MLFVYIAFLCIIKSSLKRCFAIKQYNFISDLTYIVISEIHLNFSINLMPFQWRPCCPCLRDCSIAPGMVTWLQRAALNKVSAPPSQNCQHPMTDWSVGIMALPSWSDSGTTLVALDVCLWPKSAGHLLTQSYFIPQPSIGWMPRIVIHFKLLLRVCFWGAQSATVLSQILGSSPLIICRANV